MKATAARQFFINNFYSILFAITGFIFILMLAHYGGIGLSPDSITYTSVAQSLAKQGRLHQYDDAPFVDFPAGYPFFLSIVFKIFGSDYVHTGVYLNALLFAALLFLCGLAMQRFTYTSALYKMAVLACIALNPGLLEVYSMLWSETLFILLSVLFIMALHTYIQTTGIKNLTVAALIVAVICIVRYAGIAFIAAGGFVLLFMKHTSIKQKIIHLLLFGMIAISLLACNLARNCLAEGFATGEREKSITPLLLNIRYFGIVLCDWLSLQSKNTLPVVLFAIVVIALLAAAVIYHLITQKGKTGFAYLAAVFALVYILFIIITASISRFEPIDSRFISPAFIFMLWALAYWLNRMVTATKRRLKAVSIAGNIIIAVLLMAGEATNSYASYSDIKDYGIPGYTDDDWQLSPTVQFIKAHANGFKPGVEIYSNANDAVYFFTQKHAQQLPHKESPEEIKALFNESDFYIVWFNFTDDNDDVSLKYILHNRPMKLVRKFNDGAVYISDYKTQTSAR
ncbi:hypothetical protein [Parafilimonas sp.]|uniref:hypothetical protein n=1 Tax=Parafilimonas sp. TaxID=1969739 RepID=UPI0039E257D8